jgi:hypothetical protein
MDMATAAMDIRRNHPAMVMVIHPKKEGDFGRKGRELIFP